MKFQLAPCQMPVANQTTKELRYTGSRLPTFSPKWRRENLLNFCMNLHTEMG